jgi:PPK2 family polyphosphate:nucleotide phosphotransferase
LKDVDADDTGDYKRKEQTLPRLEHLRERLFKLQMKMYAERRQRLLVIFQAMDTGGKDGVVKHIMSGVNPSGVTVSEFKAPTSEELAHDFLWRAHIRAPARGMIGIWNRSHYEDVLIVRVKQLVADKVWKRRYEDINAFEKLLYHSDMKILKFYLHISADEQRRRLQERLDDPSKNWKFNLQDLEERKRWDDYQKAYEDALNKCSTDIAPWMIVPANHKWARNLAVAEAIVDALEEMDPEYPKVDFDPKAIKVE